MFKQQQRQSQGQGNLGKDGDDKDMQEEETSLYYAIAPCVKLGHLPGMIPTIASTSSTNKQTGRHNYSMSQQCLMKATMGYHSALKYLIFWGALMYLQFVFFAKSFSLTSLASAGDAENFFTLARKEVETGGISGVVMVAGSLVPPCSTAALMAFSLLCMKRFIPLFTAMDSICMDLRSSKQLGFFGWRCHFLCLESLIMLPMGTMWAVYFVAEIFVPDLIIMAPVYEYNYIMTLGYFWQTIFGDALFHCCMAAVAHGFECLVNEKLRVVIEKCDSNISGYAWATERNKSNSDEQGINLDTIREMHGKLCVVVQLIGNCFSPWLLIVCFSCLVMLIATCFELVMQDAAREYGVPWYQVATPVLVLIMRLFLLCRSASKPMKKSEETTLILAKIPTSALDEQTRMQVIHFNTQITEGKTTVSAGGYFDVNKGLVLALFGNFCSYLIILVELRREVPPKERHIS